MEQTRSEQDQALVEQLRRAFPCAPIQAGDAFEAWGTTYVDADPYKEHLEGKSWEQLDRAYLLRRSDALGFLGTEHLIAVLPVYLRSLIEEGGWSPAAGMVTLILTRPRGGKDSGLGHVRFDAFVQAMTEAQRSVVAGVLHAFAENHPEGALGEAARDAVEDYWKRFLAPKT